MKIYEYYYDHYKRSLYVEFSLKQDGDSFYRRIELPFNDIEYYATTIVTEHDMNDIDKAFIIEVLDEYFKENELPEEDIL